MKQPRILLIDIETAPILANVWKIWDENVGLDQIESDMHLLSFAAKWFGERGIIYSDQSLKKDVTNDKDLLKKIRSLMEEADLVIAQNGRAFDLPTIKARMIYHRIPPPPPVRIIDTLDQAKKNFRFTSNKLEYLAKFLGCPIIKDEHREFPGIKLWKECVAGNQRAWKVMRRYNSHDVLSLEPVYIAMRPWITQHPNVGMYIDSDKPLCPKCGSEHLTKSKNRVTQKGKYTQYQCQNCGGYCRDAVQLESKSKLKLQLHN